MQENLHYLTFDEVGITVAGIAVALAFVVLVWNAVKAIHDWRYLVKKPTDDRIDDHEKRISYLEGCCEEVHGKLQNDWEFQRDEKEFNVIMLEAVGQLMKHALDGNDTDGLKAADEKIDRYLREASQR